MKISLYPFNVYILYGALVILVLCLVLTLVHAMKMLKQLTALTEGAERMQQKSDALNASLQKQQAKKAAKKITFKQILAAWLFLTAVKKDYDRHERNGVKQAADSAKNVYTSRVMRKVISDNRINIL